MGEYLVEDAIRRIKGVIERFEEVYTIYKAWNEGRYKDALNYIESELNFLVNEYEEFKEYPEYRRAIMESVIPVARKYGHCFSDKEDILKAVKYLPESMSMKLSEKEGRMFEQMSAKDLADIAEVEPRVIEYISKEKFAEVIVIAIQNGNLNTIGFVQNNQNLKFFEESKEVTRQDKEDKLNKLMLEKGKIDSQVEKYKSEIEKDNTQDK